MEKGKKNEEYVGDGGRGGLSCFPLWSLSFKVKLLQGQSGAQPHQHKRGECHGQAERGPWSVAFPAAPVLYLMGMQNEERGIYLVRTMAMQGDPAAEAETLLGQKQGEGLADLQESAACRS